MAAEIFTDDWARAWCEEINASPAYRKAAAEWEGEVVLQLSANPARGIDRDRAICADLWHGECRAARAATEEDLAAAPFVIRGDPHSWGRVLEGSLDPIMGLMRGKLKLTRGKLTTLARYVLAAKELVAAATRVDSSFPEGWA